jgi:hypothetical protein
MLSLKKNRNADVTLVGIIELLLMLTCLLVIVLQLAIDKIDFNLIIGIISVGGLGIVSLALLMRYFIQKVK